MSYNNTYKSSLNIDLISTDAIISQSDTHKIFEIKENIELPKGTHFIIGLQSFAIPFTFYTFREGINNTFTLGVYIDDTLNTVDISIDEGNYSASDLIAYLNTQLTLNRLTLGLTLISSGFDYIKNKLYFSCVPTPDYITITNNTAYKQLGNNASDILYPNSSNKFYFPYCVYLANSSVIYVKLRNKMSNINTKNVNGIIASVYIDTMPGGIIYYVPNEIQYFKLDSLKLNTLEIELLDDTMQSIGSLNTMVPWHMTLTVHYSYNKFPEGVNVNNNNNF